MTDFSPYSDEALIEKLHTRPEEEDAIEDFLLDKYKPLVRKISNEFFIIGAESEDLLQEGMIGLFKAIRDYSADKDTEFQTFAYLCIRRQIYTAIETSNRKKHAPLNSYVSFSTEEDAEGGLEDLLADQAISSPEDLVIEQEFWEELYRELNKKLSKMEFQVLSYYREGKHYLEIAKLMDKEPKAIDNAIQRIRKKVSLWNSQESGHTPSAVLSQKKKSRT